MIRGEHDEDVQRVHVRRSHLLHDAFRAFSKPTFNCSKMLKVTFIGEESVDDGGPRREFFQVHMRECFNKSGLFVGWPSNTVPVHNVEAIANNKFYIVGKMLSTCIIQGGQPPVCFSQGIADYLVYDEIRSKPCLEDIDDYAVRQKLLKVRLFLLVIVCVTLYGKMRQLTNFVARNTDRYILRQSCASSWLL